MQYQIVVGGQVVQRTSGAPSQPFVRHFDDSHGFADPEVEQRRWRVFVVRDEERQFEVQVGQRYKKRYDILEELAEHLWLPVAGFLAAAGAGMLAADGQGAQTAAGDRLERLPAKSPSDLAQVELAGQPRELLPIVQALNGVLGGWTWRCSPSAALRPTPPTNCARRWRACTCMCNCCSASIPNWRRRSRSCAAISRASPPWSTAC